MLWLCLWPERSVARESDRCQGVQGQGEFHPRRRETLVIQRQGEPIAFFVPITAKDRRIGRDVIGRLGRFVDDVVSRSGIDEDELVREISPRRRQS